MEFLKVARRRSFVSNTIYHGLNVALAVAILVVIQVSGSPLPAFALVFLSKWRILAVRPRYWFANLQANLVDLIVSIGLVMLLYAAGGNLIVQSIMTLLYIGWLLFMKPRSKRTFMVAQAGVAVFVGVSALYMIAYAWPVVFVVLAMWLIGYASARHVLGAYDETHITFLSLIWGLVFAELGWIAYHWTIAYSLPGFGGVELPQITLIVFALSFVAERFYRSYTKHEKVRMDELLLPMLLSGSVIALILALALWVFFHSFSI